jgi:hypothetical protein
LIREEADRGVAFVRFWVHALSTPLPPSAMWRSSPPMVSSSSPRRFPPSRPIVTGQRRRDKSQRSPTGRDLRRATDHEAVGCPGWSFRVGPRGRRPPARISEDCVSDGDELTPSSASASRVKSACRRRYLVGHARPLDPLRFGLRWAAAGCSAGIGVQPGRPGAPPTGRLLTLQRETSPD